MSKKLLMMLIVWILSTAAFGQCAYTFTSGGTGTKPYLQYCISLNGNFVEFQTPMGSEQIGPPPGGQSSDGYAICDLTGKGDYLDYGLNDYHQLEWQAPTLLSKTDTVVKIARTTYDGIWTLTQTFTQNSADASVKVVMTIKNNSAITRSIWLTRVTDINANNTDYNILDGTTDTVFGYDVSEHGHGLQISLAAANPYPHEGFATYTPLSPFACGVGNHYGGLINGYDGAANLLHVLTIRSGGSKTVALKYKGM
jgi:hypothetical protein